MFMRDSFVADNIKNNPIAQMFNPMAASLNKEKYK